MRELAGRGEWQRVSIACVCTLLFGAAACGKAELEANPGQLANAGSSNAAGGADAQGGASASAGTGARPDAGAGNAEGGAVGEEDGLSAVPSELRRLTAAEYTATARDVLGTAQKPDLAGFATEEDHFDNNASVNGVSDPLYFRYLETAEALADEVFASDSLRPRIVTCAQADDATCVRQVVSQAGLRLFRRPLLEDELVVYQKAYTRARARAESHEGALKQVLIALLASAQFVFRMEFVPSQAGSQLVSPYDLATRLSYLLWGSAPDTQLLDAAKQDELATNEQLAATVSRLLEDAKSERFAQNFAGQWLDLRALRTASFEPQLAWTPELAAAAANEIHAYFLELLGPDQDFRGFFDGRAHFVDSKLASLYGLTVAGPATQRLELRGVDRRGFLGLVGFLAQTSTKSRGSPSQRGAWIVSNLLCSALPPLVIDMPPYQDNEASLRYYLSSVSPECLSCHAQFDGFGFALENYDAIGRYRTSYPDLSAIDAQVTLPPAVAAPAAVSGMAGLSAALANTPAFTECTVQKLYTYGFGRAFTAGEHPNVQALTEQWRNGPLTMRELIVRLVQSRTFRARSDGGT